MLWRRFRTAVITAFIMIAMLVLLAPDWPAFGERDHQIDAIVRQERRFDFVIWQAGALRAKLDGLLDGGALLMSPQERSDYVLRYLDLIHQAQRKQSEINAIYSDPAIDDHRAAAAADQAELDELRAEIAAMQTRAEAIMQQQVAAALHEEGFSVAGLVFPPVLMHMSPLPNMLIVSPRDRIAQIENESILPGLPTEEKEQMETQVAEQLDLSALVVPIGGLGMYPAMVMETSDVEWLASVTAHEWTHHYLSFRPLGLRYLDSPEMRTINETVASIVDLEIGQRVMEMSYAPQQTEAEVAAAESSPVQGPPMPPAFDFRAEMGETRVEVDRLLAEGKVDEAEAYMEQRRELFVENGYQIRKLNQAYFAFYGGYAAAPGGASAGDPVGAMVREIRAASPTLKDFLDRVSGIKNYDELQQRYQEMTGNDPADLTAN